MKIGANVKYITFDKRNAGELHNKFNALVKQFATENGLKFEPSSARFGTFEFTKKVKLTIETQASKATEELDQKFKFQRFGREQVEISELFPHIGSVVDDICLIRSMTTDAINHDPAHMFMNTGAQIAGRPSMGKTSIAMNIVDADAVVVNLVYHGIEGSAAQISRHFFCRRNQAMSDDFGSNCVNHALAPSMWWRTSIMSSP